MMYLVKECLDELSHEIFQSLQYDGVIFSSFFTIINGPPVPANLTPGTPFPLCVYFPLSEMAFLIRYKVDRIKEFNNLLYEVVNQYELDPQCCVKQNKQNKHLSYLRICDN